MNDIGDVVNVFLGLISLILPIVAGLSLLVFVWGIVKFIWNAGDAKTHEEGKSLMIWGLIILFVMVSLMGILQFVSRDTVGESLVLPLIGSDN